MAALCVRPGLCLELCVTLLTTMASALCMAASHSPGLTAYSWHGKFQLDKGSRKEQKDPKSLPGLPIITRPRIGGRKK